MKTTKEWAAQVVDEPHEIECGMWNVALIDEHARVALIEPSGEDDARDLTVDTIGIIERLVERAQADARAPDTALVDALRAIETRDDGLCADPTTRDLASHLYVYGATSSELERGGAAYVMRVMLEALANLGHRQKLAREVVERQRDEAQAEVAKLRAENERLHAEHAEYLAFIADQNDMRAEEHEQIRKENR